ncbi:MAG: enoyl-CoA hydratase, partial [Chloroflexota bacterium]|nr:enoyl-CoA hydratase [Chloroflexota bacterium]
MSYETINIEQVQRVAIVTLNRPEVLNALNLQLVRELDEA